MAGWHWVPKNVYRMALRIGLVLAGSFGTLARAESLSPAHAALIGQLAPCLSGEDAPSLAPNTQPPGGHSDARIDRLLHEDSVYAQHLQELAPYHADVSVALDGLSVFQKQKQKNLGHFVSDFYLLVFNTLQNARSTEKLLVSRLSGIDSLLKTFTRNLSADERRRLSVDRKATSDALQVARSEVRKVTAARDKTFGAKSHHWFEPQNALTIKSVLAARPEGQLYTEYSPESGKSLNPSILEAHIARVVMGSQSAKVLGVGQRIKANISLPHPIFGHGAWVKSQDVTIGEIDVNTSVAAIESTIAHTGKADQLVALLERQDKPVVLFAPYAKPDYLRSILPRVEQDLLVRFGANSQYAKDLLARFKSQVHLVSCSSGRAVIMLDCDKLLAETLRKISQTPSASP